MKLSQNIAEIASSLYELTISLDRSADCLESIESDLQAENQRLQAENNKLLQIITNLQSEILANLAAENDNQALKVIKTRAKMLSKKLQRSERVIWSCYLEACLNCVIDVNNDVNPEPHE